MLAASFRCPDERRMSDQMSLMGFDPPPVPTDRLFLALLPDGPARERIAQAIEGLRADHGLTAKAVQPDKLHVTLFHVGDFPGIPPGLLDQVNTAAAQAARVAPFEVSFDRAASFTGRPGNRPFVLRGGDALAPLMSFQKGLADALARVAIVRKDRAYTPHVTLLYDDPLVPEQTVAPVSWTVSEFVLIDSLMNQPVKRYDVLARWPLSG